MKHYSEQELILHKFGESPEPQAVDAHLEGCERCRSEFEALGRLLESVVAPPVPERPAGYPARVWERLRPRIEKRRAPDWRAWFSPRRLVLAGAAVVVLLAAFLVGHERGERTGVEAVTAEVRERVLMFAVGEHLERSERMLIELVNAEPGPSLDLNRLQLRARRLAADNRVFRAMAHRGGRRDVAHLLEELERLLLDITNSRPTPSASELHAIWRRIEGNGLLVRMRTLGSDARQRSRGGTPADLTNET